MQWVFRIGRGKYAVWGTIGIGAFGAAALWAAPQLPGLAGYVEEAVAAEPSAAAEEEPAAHEAPRGATTTDRLNLRTGPATTFDRVAVLRSGRDLAVLRQQDDWLFVRAGDREGWVHSDFVELGLAAAPPPGDDLAAMRREAEAWSADRQQLVARIDALEEENGELQQALRDIRGEVDFGSEIVPQVVAAAPDDRGGRAFGWRAGRRELRALQQRVAALEAERDDLAEELEANRSVPGDPQSPAAASDEPPEAAPATSLADLQLENARLQRELSASEQARESLWASIDQLRQQVAASRGEAAPATVEDAQPAAASRGAVAARVREWAASWSAQDPPAYLAFYSPEFEPASGLSRAAWEAQRESRLTRPEFIEVRVDELEIDFDDDGRAVATFMQAYRSNRYSDRVRKTLRWRREGDDWKIDSERVGRRP